MQLCLTTVSALGLTPALAYIDPTGPIPITAEQAFDAVATGCLPDTPDRPGACYGVGKVVLVDVRTQSELDFQGGPAKVDSIEMKDGTVIVPAMGKAKLSADSKFLEYNQNGKPRRLSVNGINEVVTSLIGKLAPCSTYDPVDSTFKPDKEGFSRAMMKIANEMDAAGRGPNVAITMCNSGGRSTQCPLNFLWKGVQDRFFAWYEIDRAGDEYITPEAFGLPAFVEAGAPPPGIHMAVLGGYSGSDYGGDYNGIVGFPGRFTNRKPVSGWTVGDPGVDFRFAAPSGPSVSWKDSGLPIYIPAVQCILTP